MKKKLLFNLQLFTDGGDGGTGTGAGSAGNGDGGQKGNAGGTGQGGTYSFEQAEEIANARADRAEKAALASYFKQQGMTEDEVTAALADFKAKKAAQQPNVSKVEQERDAALAQVEEMKNTNYLRDKGVKPDDLDYVLYKVSKSAVLQRGRRLANMTAAQYKMPVLDLLPVAYFVNGEGGSAKKKLTTMAWDKKVIYAEEIAVIVPISEAVLDDADYDIWGEVRPRLIEAFGQKIDGAILFGQDKPQT